jgi:23S rRNA G2445 N2-methylase RlmL
MPKFFATTPRGLELVLEKELHDLGITKTKLGIAGVEFHTNWAGCYKANLEVTSASRILYPVLDFPAYEPDHVYHNVLKHDWTKYIRVDQTLAMDSSVRDSVIRDLRIVALKAKDAVVDQFAKKYGSRPDVDTENPDMQVSLRLVKNICTVSLDTSGGSLHYRGYRDRGAPAPLKENLAAALVKMTGWDEKSPLMDPMCGSGTFCIEAALMALKIPPGVFRKRFGFQRWLTFQAEPFKQLRDEIGARALDDVPFRIYGSDCDMRAVAAARANTENAGTEVATIFRRQDVSEFVPAPTPGVLITNPPYGERMGENEDLVGLYAKLGNQLKEKFQGWKAFVLTSDPTLAKALDLKPTKSTRVYNGAIECQFLRFDL